MRIIAMVTVLTIVSHHAVAERLTCEALKDRLDVKLQAKGVPVYTLEIVPANVTLPSAKPASGVGATKNSGKGKVVGTCDIGTKQLIYTRGD